MADKKLCLEGVEYRGPEDHYDGRKKHTAVLPKAWDSEWSDTPSLVEQVEDCDRDSVGPYKNPVSIDLEAQGDRKAWILWDPEHGNAGRDFNMRTYLENE